ncbi:MAG: carboxymuconolactone decarboxylase family protein [Gammaproteobacteria bacterium]|nr:carboxymuconolactone decarboxylase family protein [Gammaproteobacteria bacterium]
MRGPSPLPPLQREFVFTYVSALNGCDFCLASHSIVVERYGASPALVDTLLAGRGADEVVAPMRPVLDHARALTERPGGIRRADVDAVPVAGRDETALVHVACVIALANMCNRIVSGLGIEAEPGIVRMGGEMLHAHGYLPNPRPPATGSLIRRRAYGRRPAPRYPPCGAPIRAGVRSPRADAPPAGRASSDNCFVYNRPTISPGALLRGSAVATVPAPACAEPEGQSHRCVARAPGRHNVAHHRRGRGP